MSTIIQDILNTYYGLGRENQSNISLTSHQAAISVENALKNSISTEYIIDTMEENEYGKQSSTEVNDTQNAGANDSDEKMSRSWRALSNDDLNDNITYRNDTELILDSNETQGDTAPDNDNGGVDLKLSTNIQADSGEVEASQASVGILEVLVQDNVSDASLSLTLKKKPNGKFRTKSVPTFPKQLSPIRSKSPIRKNPVYNNEFFDMSNASMTEFPMKLIDKIQNIRMLYLEKNTLENLPAELFINLKLLEWLDVRHNKLMKLPETIKYHPSLETILLQDNLFQRLPLELAVIPNLIGLQIQDNPLIYPPSNVLTLGFEAIIKFLREQWNIYHPDEIVSHPKEVKSALTILCEDLPRVKRNISSTLFPKLHKSNSSIREKSWNYKPSNRCDSSGKNAILQAKLLWISKIKDQLNKQTAVLQKMKDRDALKKWRQDRRSYNRSIKKAENRTCTDIPFGVDYSDIPFLCKQHQEKLELEKQMNLPKKDINTKMSDISMSLRQLQIDQQSGILDVTTELKRLQNEIQKLTQLQQQIHSLKNENQMEMSKYYGLDLCNDKREYKPPPSIII